MCRCDNKTYTPVNYPEWLLKIINAFLSWSQIRNHHIYWNTHVYIIPYVWMHTKMILLDNKSLSWRLPLYRGDWDVLKCITVRIFVPIFIFDVFNVFLPKCNYKRKWLTEHRTKTSYLHSWLNSENWTPTVYPASTICSPFLFWVWMSMVWGQVVVKMDVWYVCLRRARETAMFYSKAY